MKISYHLILILLFSFFSCNKQENSSNIEFGSATKITTLMEKVGDDHFKIQNTEDANLPVHTITLVEHFQPRLENETFKFVVTAPLNATDFGAYKDIYLVYHNGYEMPSRIAVFKVGSTADISSIRQLSPESFQIQANLFNPGYDTGTENYYDGEVTIEVNAYDVLDQNRLLDNQNSSEEGHLASTITVRVR
jgi:hypothetical protein